MDNSFPQQGSDTQQRRGFAAGLRILDRLENWLAHLMQFTQLTEEEQKQAGIHLMQLAEEENESGIYPGDQRDGRRLVPPLDSRVWEGNPDEHSPRSHGKEKT